MLATAAKVDADFEAQWPDHEPAAIEVRLADGTVLAAEVPGPKGGLDLPMSADELHAKFRTLVEPVLGAERAGEITAAVDGVEQLDDIGTLACLLAP